MPAPKSTSTWRHLANCAGKPVQWWYPDAPITSQQVADMNVAKALCADCAAQWDCLAEATLRPEQYGIWASTSPKTRARLRRLTDPTRPQPDWRIGPPGEPSPAPTMTAGTAA